MVHPRRLVGWAKAPSGVPSRAAALARLFRAHHVGPLVRLASAYTALAADRDGLQAVHLVVLAPVEVASDVPRCVGGTNAIASVECWGVPKAWRTRRGRR